MKGKNKRKELPLTSRIFFKFTAMRFADIIGHSELKERLIHSVSEKRISHAQLFLGEEGTGALPLAIAYAQFIACTDKKKNDSCGACNSCLKFSKFIHPDVHFTYPVSPVKDFPKPKSIDFIIQWRNALSQNPYMSFLDWAKQLEIDNKQPQISVFESADIIQALSLKSVEGGYKYVILWLPEKMHISAATKLLKSLEEPEPHTLFILISENYESIIKTISSRTQLVQVSRIADKDLAEALEKNYQLNAARAKSISRLAEGNYNLAMKLVQSETAESNTEPFLTWMRLCYSLNYKELILWIEGMIEKRREGQKNFLSYALDICRECVLMNYGDNSLVRISENEIDELKRFSPFITVHNAEGIMEKISKAYYHIERNANPKILFMSLSLEMNKLLAQKQAENASV
jgi:DNA polymerase-3 subunit delta'